MNYMIEKMNAARLQDILLWNGILTRSREPRSSIHFSFLLIWASEARNPLKKPWKAKKFVMTKIIILTTHVIAAAKDVKINIFQFSLVIPAFITNIQM